MHELTLCKSILEIINTNVIGRKGIRVKKISLEVGQLMAVDIQALVFSFDVVAKGTVAEHAILDIIEIEGQAECDNCSKLIAVKRYYDPCPMCGQISLTVRHGQELRVKDMEIE